MPMNEKNFDYAPENINEEYAFLAGRVKALEDVLSMEDGSFIEKKKVATILGIEYEKGESANEVL